MQATATGLRSQFITATAAARHMAGQDSGGVILALTSGSSTRQGPMMGGTRAGRRRDPVVLRSLAAETGPSGVRVAAFLASDRAAGITGTIVNVTCGLVVG